MLGENIPLPVIVGFISAVVCAFIAHYYYFKMHLELMGTASWSQQKYDWKWWSSFRVFTTISEYEKCFPAKKTALKFKLYMLSAWLLGVLTYLYLLIVGSKCPN